MQSTLNASQIITMFSGGRLNREDEHRANDDLWQEWLMAPTSRFCLLCGEGFAVTDEYRLQWFTKEELSDFTIETSLLLGRDTAGTAFFACRLTDETPPPLKWAVWRAMAFHAPAPTAELSLIAQARSMLDWHHSHRFCSRCGGESQPVRMGYERRCPKCGACHFPRTDPVVIMIGWHKDSDQLLVGRPASMPPGMYTALAGFMEPGETIEEATARELKEEAGVSVTKVTYLASQPWPSPSNIMIGCVAEIDDLSLSINTEEIEEARWLSRADLSAMIDGTHPEGLTLPPPLAIAHQLISWWLTDSSPKAASEQ